MVLDPVDAVSDTDQIVEFLPFELAQDGVVIVLPFSNLAVTKSPGVALSATFARRRSSIEIGTIGFTGMI